METGNEASLASGTSLPSGYVEVLCVHPSHPALTASFLQTESMPKLTDELTGPLKMMQVTWPSLIPSLHTTALEWRLGSRAMYA